MAAFYAFSELINKELLSRNMKRPLDEPLCERMMIGKGVKKPNTEFLAVNENLKINIVSRFENKP